MNRAYGTINSFMRGNRLVFEAIYQPSYRHTAYRVCNIGDEPAPMYPTEATALSALQSRALIDGCEITVKAGSYDHGGRKHGEVVA